MDVQQCWFLSLSIVHPPRMFAYEFVWKIDVEAQFFASGRSIYNIVLHVVQVNRRVTVDGLGGARSATGGQQRSGERNVNGVHLKQIVSICITLSTDFAETEPSAWPSVGKCVGLPDGGVAGNVRAGFSEPVFS